MTKSIGLTDFISRRLSNKKARSAHIVLSQNNIYIFPSSAGMVFVVLLVTLLVTAINYQNSLIYLLTFLLGAMFFISIWLCFLNLSGLEIFTDSPADAFEGEGLNFRLTLLQSHKSAPAIRFGADSAQTTEAFIEKGIKKTVSLLQPPSSRGYHQLDRLYLSTLFPFGLIRAWTWLKTESGVFVCPAPVEPVYAPGSTQAGKSSHDNRVNIESSGDLKSYVAGDTLARVAWKQFAARDELYIRAYDATAGEVHQWVDWQAYAASNIEQRLGMMCSDILRLGRERKRFGVRLPGQEIAQGSGPEHERECLRALAVFGR